MNDYTDLMTEQTEPRQSLVPTKLSRFVIQPENRESLKRILRDPAFIAALNLLGEQNRVSDAMLTSLPDTVLARKAAYHAGVSGVYERLEALAHHTPAEADPGEWDHLKPNQ